MKNKRGFTLVELLAVVVILGILMTISIPAVTRWINRSKMENLESQRQSLLMASPTNTLSLLASVPETFSLGIYKTTLFNSWK